MEPVQPGGCNYQFFQFDNDQWFYFSLEETTQIVIDLNTNYQAPENSVCTLSNNGTNQGIILILWTGINCADMFPILNTWNPSWCNGTYSIPNCPYGLSTCASQCGNNSNLPNHVDPSHPAYISTAYWNYSCCVNWFNSCNNYYNNQLLFYNISFSNWIVEQTGQAADGIIPNTNPQNFLIFTELPAGNYWIQLDPISCNPNTGGYASEGTGTINVCNLILLGNTEDQEDQEIFEKPEPFKREMPRPRKIIHPRYGLVVITPDGRAINSLFQQVDLHEVKSHDN